MKVLIVEDEDQLAGLVQRELQREYDHQVTISVDLEEAGKRLSEDVFDVVVADILYDPLVTEFDLRVGTDGVRPTDRPLLGSGLSVLATARGLSPAPGMIVWTSGDTLRRLHLIFAYEDLGVRSFCSKRSGSGTLRPLHRAITAAAASQPYVDNVLSVYLPEPGAIPLGNTLLRDPKRRLFWRALALGYRTAKEIAIATKYSEKTVRNEMGDMFNDLRLVDPGVPDVKKPQPEVIHYATRNRYFFLDEAVRQVYS